MVMLLIFLASTLAAGAGHLGNEKFDGKEQQAQNKEQNASSLNVALIVGCVTGCIVAVLFIAYCCKKDEADTLQAEDRSDDKKARIDVSYLHEPEEDPDLITAIPKIEPI